jgi:hypothetical protein
MVIFERQQEEGLYLPSSPGGLTNPGPLGQVGAEFIEGGLELFEERSGWTQIVGCAEILEGGRRRAQRGDAEIGEETVQAASALANRQSVPGDCIAPQCPDQVGRLRTERRHRIREAFRVAIYRGQQGRDRPGEVIA